MRGKQKFPALPRNVFGITPADAGKTGLAAEPATVCVDHPRGCGENIERPYIIGEAVGSPPRMRGKQDGTGIFILRGRITPADAGKTSSPCGLDRTNMDHPRGCGENSAANDFKHLSRGSPPRMRGKRLFCEPFKAEARITPADAGKTIQSIVDALPQMDHPRGCGENSSIASSILYIEGSPPRMRGKPRFALQTARGQRITPADAGKTADACRRFPPVWDHPRGCGENIQYI